MAWGLDFSGKKTSSKTNEVIDATKVESGTQTGSQTGSQSTVGTTTGSQTGTSASQGSSSTSQTGTTTQAGTGSQISQQLAQLFSSPVLTGLESTAAKLLGGVGGSAADAAISSGLAQQGQFDPATFINNGLAAAQSQLQSGLDESMGGILDAVGGKNNSAVALLESKLNNQAGATLAGIKGDLTGQAAQIVNQGLGAATAAKGVDSQLLASVLDILKGGRATTQGQEQTASSQTGTTANTGTTNTTEASQTQQNSQQQQTEIVNTLLNTLLQTLTNTTLHQTTNSKTSGTELGAKASLSG